MIDRDELTNSWEIFRDKMISALPGKGKQITPDRKNVIKGLQHCDFGVSSTCYEKECPYYQSHDCTDEIKSDILALLKEQEAVEPYITGSGESFETAETWWYECGNCNKPIDPNDKFCRHCGKPVQWE